MTGKELWYIAQAHAHGQLAGLFEDTQRGDLERGEQFNMLRNADILAPLEDAWVVSVGGLLLFGRQPQRRLPHSTISFAVFDGDDSTAELLDKKELTGVFR